MTFVDIAVAALGLPVLAWTSYLGFLALFSAENHVPAAEAPPRLRFDLVVPAHDEELGIGATVTSLLGVDYPRELFRVLVVADNCRDATEKRAAEAGALVLVRNDASLRGKGYALAHAFERSLADGVADAVVVVDADTQVTPNLLRAFGSRISAGARAVQAEYGVANPNASWRTRLMRIALALFHDLRSRARERLGVSAGLRGNGMAFTAALLREVPHEAFSIVEDVEYGIRLGSLGYRVHYAGEAQVLGEMVAGERGSRSQRRRWEGGRLALARQHAWPLVRAALRTRSALLLDLAADLLVPPLTYVVCALVVGLVVSAAWVAFGHGAPWSLVPWCLGLLGFSLYLVRGVVLARVGPRAILDLMWAPVYMVWKIGLARRAPSAPEGEWVRTVRNEKNS
jgi:cellulose synthase/poly-beta-1,6-N-acetylglucosamine synthase-like glycosyltransferase